MIQPGGLSEATVAVPAAGVAIALGIVSPADALTQVRELGPTVSFLAAILLVAYLADTEGAFRWLGDRLASSSRGRPHRLLAVVFVSAAVTTAVLSLDATVVLFTPVVFGTAARLRLRPKPHVYACTHLANSASTLLPIHCGRCRRGCTSGRRRGVAARRRCPAGRGAAWRLWRAAGPP